MTKELDGLCRISVRLPENWYNQFSRIARNSGQTKTKLLRTCIVKIDHFEDLNLNQSGSYKVYNFRISKAEKNKIINLGVSQTTAVKAVVKQVILQQLNLDNSKVSLDQSWEVGDFRQLTDGFVKLKLGGRVPSAQSFFRYTIANIELGNFIEAGKSIEILECMDALSAWVLKYGLAVVNKDNESARIWFRKLAGYQLSESLLPYLIYYSALENFLSDRISQAEELLNKSLANSFSDKYIELKSKLLQCELLICHGQFQSGIDLLSEIGELTTLKHFSLLFPIKLGLESVILFQQGNRNLAESLAIQSINMAKIHGGTNLYVDQVERFLPYWIIDYNQRLLFTYYGQLNHRQSDTVDLYRHLVMAANGVKRKQSKTVITFSTKRSLNNLISSSTDYLYGDAYQKNSASQTLTDLATTGPYQLIRSASTAVLSQQKFQFAI